MQVGDLIMYVGHLGIILEPVDNCSKHWKVFFFKNSAYITIYEPLVKKYQKFS